MNDRPVELYKIYRPTRWENLIGQSKVANSLKGAVLKNLLPTAYLFAGPRGCGKTSSAFILAKAINCLDLPESGNPCNKCASCISIEANTQLGVNYRSMANGGGVEDIRKLVQEARLYQPVNRQVWILDEVHNISKSAWDALLIPLEDRTMPALFILCTTEIEKVPSTILSRVQQRKFNLVEAETIIPFIKKVAKYEKLELDDSTLNAAVRMGRGSVRDTLTALETIIETGESASSFTGQLLESMSKRNLPEVLKVIAAANAESIDFREFAEQLFEDLRDVLLIGSGVDRSLVGIPPVLDEDSLIKGMLGSRGIMIMMNEVGDGITQMSMGADSRIILEVSLMKGLATLNKLEKAIQSKSSN